jgi:hypothetical protein
VTSLNRRCRTAGTWMWKRFRLVAGVALLVGIALTLDAHRDALAAFDWSLDPLVLAGSIALLAAAPLAQALTLRIALRRLGADAPTAPTLRVWARSFLLRYEPSGALGFVYASASARPSARRRHRSSPHRATSSSRP